MRFILVLEANCISNLSPNHTLQLTTIGTFVRVSLQLRRVQMYDAFALIQAGAISPSVVTNPLQDPGCISGSEASSVIVLCN